MQRLESQQTSLLSKTSVYRKLIMFLALFLVLYSAAAPVDIYCCDCLPWRTASGQAFTQVSDLSQASGWESAISAPPSPSPGAAPNAPQIPQGTIPPTVSVPALNLNDTQVSTSAPQERIPGIITDSRMDIMAAVRRMALALFPPR